MSIDTSIEAVTAADNEVALCAIYDAWLEANELEPMSADELRSELWANDLNINERMQTQIDWLTHFIERWEEIV